MRLAIAAALLALVLSACATTGDAPREAPDRQITINAPAAKVKTAVSALFVQKGFVISKEGDLTLTFDQPSTNEMENLFVGTIADPQVNHRIVVEFVGDNPTLVAWHGYVVQNPTTQFEREIEVTNSADNDPIEVALEGVKTNLETSK